MLWFVCSKAAVCASARASWSPTNPVVVHRAGALPFILGTVPKVACTNLRKLLLVLINYHPYKPQPLPGRKVPLDMSVRIRVFYVAAVLPLYASLYLCVMSVRLSLRCRPCPAYATTEQLASLWLALRALIKYHATSCHRFQAARRLITSALSRRSL